MALGVVLNRNRQVPAEDSPAFGAIAERFRRAGDLERAVALCQDGLKKFPGHTSARVTLGWALLDLGRYDEARSQLEQVLKRTPDNLAAIRGLAELHDRSEHDEVAAINRGDSEWMRDMAAAAAAAEEESASQLVHQPDSVVEPAIPAISSVAAPPASAPVADDSISALFAAFEDTSGAAAHVDLDAGAVVTTAVAAGSDVEDNFAGVPYPAEKAVAAPAAEARVEGHASSFAESTVVSSPVFVTAAQAAIEAAAQAEAMAQSTAHAESEARTHPEAVAEPVAVEATEVVEATAENDAVAVADVAVQEEPEPVAVAAASEATFDDADAVIDEPVADEAVAVVDEPVVAVDEPVEVSEPVQIAASVATVLDDEADQFDPPVHVESRPAATVERQVAEPIAPVAEPLPVAAAARVITPADVVRPVVVAEHMPAPVAETIVEPLELVAYDDPRATAPVAELSATDLSEFPELLPDAFVLPEAVEAARADADEGPGPWPPVIPDDPAVPAVAQAAAAPTRERPVINALNRFLKRVETRKSTSVSEYLAG